MTVPTIVFFGFDFSPTTTPKIFLRTLLYSTSARGCVIEAMYAKLTQMNDTEVFSFWGYGETNKLSPGSGLFIEKTGFSANHHFVLSFDKPAYAFNAGQYKIEVFAQLVGKRAPEKLRTIELTLTHENAEALSQREGILFEFSPETKSYNGHRRDSGD